MLLNAQNLLMRDVKTDDQDGLFPPLGARRPFQTSLSSTSGGLSSMSIDAHLHRAGHNLSSDLENELLPHTDSSRFPFPNSAANDGGTYDYEETMHRPQKSSTIQPDCRNDNRELQGKSLPKPTVAALITTSTTITADTEADQQQSRESIQTSLNSASSSWCGTSTQLQVLGKPFWDQSLKALKSIDPLPTLLTVLLHLNAPAAWRLVMLRNVVMLLTAPDGFWLQWSNIRDSSWR